MALHVTEFTFLEYFASSYGIPVPRHLTGTAEIAQIKQTLKSWKDQALVKPDVISGGRGKSGSVVPAANIQEVIKAIKNVSGMEISGQMPRIAYLVEKIPAQLEMYTAITYNTNYLGPSFTLSLEGGIDIEEVPDEKKTTIPIDVYRGLDAYQASEILAGLDCPQDLISSLSRAFISFWDLFISTGMESAEINPWRVTPEGKPYACDFKAVIDETNYKSRIPGVVFPEYPAQSTDFEDDMSAWNASSHQGQAYVADLEGTKILPILFGGGASTIITETLEVAGGSPMFLSDFGGNPPYERMLGTAKRCFDYKLADARLLLILGGKANNTFIDITFQAIADALRSYAEESGPVRIPVVIGRGGPRLVKGILIMKQTLEYLKLPYVIFGPDTPVTLVAGYAAGLVKAMAELEEE